MDAMCIRSTATLVLVASLLESCFSYRTITLRDLHARPDVVRVTLSNGTRVVVDAPRLVGGEIVGTPTDCEGSECPRAMRSERIPVSAVNTIENRVSSETGRGFAVAGVVLVVAALVTGVVLVATMFKFGGGSGFGGSSGGSWDCE